jgi:tetratricopeptide (TPR) repeat protein
MNSSAPLLRVLVLALLAVPLCAPSQPGAAASPAKVDPITGLPVNSTGASASPQINPRNGLPVAAGDNAAGVVPGDSFSLVIEAQQLVSDGRYKDALQRLLDYYELARASTTGPRLGFALGDWVDLGRKYPPARQALSDIQKRDTLEFSEGRGDSSLFQELAQLNHALQQREETYALFKAIDRADPRLAKQCYLFAETLLVQHAEYELCLNCLGDVQRRFEILVRSYQFEQGATKRLMESQKMAAQRVAEVRQTNRWPMPPVSRADTAGILKKAADDRFVTQVCRWVEILVGTKRQPDAEKLRDQALAVLDDSRLKSAVEDAEKRVRH